MELDVRQLGNLSYKQLQELNKLQKEEDLQEAASLLAPQRITPYTQGVTQDTAYQVGTAVGDSAFDEEVYTQSDLLYNRFGDIRANNQPTALKWINGIGKMGVLAGTTFADGIGGLVVGFGQGIFNLMDKDKDSGFWSGFWDNPFSRAMQDIQKTAEEYMPNYRTEAEANRPWWENLGTANFWADTVVKNLGFAIGAAAGAGIVSKGITLGGRLGKWISAATKSARAEGLTNAVVGNTLMAFNEARVEALHNTTHWEETAIREVNSRADVELAEAERLYGKDTADYNIAAANIEKGRQEALNKINHEKTQMGNAIMGLNVPVLMLNNMFMYSKLFSGGANTLRRSMQGRVGVTAAKSGDDAVAAAKKSLDDLGENATKAEIRAAKKALKQAEREAKQAAKGSRGSILDVEGHIGQYVHNPRGTAYGFGKWLSHGASEGAEELAQRMISEGAGQYQSFDVMEWYKRGKDPNYKMKATNLVEHVMKGYEGSWGDANAWEEFVVGAFTGLLGIPQIRSRTYREQQVNPETGELEMVEKKRSPIYLAGGLQEIMQDLKVQNQREAEIVKYLNDRIQDPKFQKQFEHLAANLQSGIKLEEAIKKNDLFSYKNEEFKQLVKDISMFSQAGRIQDYKDLINHLLDPSDENVKTVVEQTTSILERQELDELFGEFAGQAEIINTEDIQSDENESNATTTPQKNKRVQFVNTPENVEFVKNKLRGKRDKLIELADLIEETKQDIDNKTGGRFTSEELAFLTQLRMTSLNHQERARTLIRENRNIIAQVIKDMSPEDRNKLSSLIRNTSGFTLSNETQSGIDPRLQREETKNEKDAILALLSNTEGTLTDKQADSIADLFLNNSAFVDYFGQSIVNQQIQGDEKVQTVNNMIRNIDDAMANKDWSYKYNQALSNFLNKPDKLQQAMDKADKELYEEYMQGRVDEYYAAINEAKDIHSLRDIKSKFSVSNSLKTKAYEKAKKEGNERLVKLIEDEDELTLFANNLSGYLQFEANQLSQEEVVQLNNLVQYISNEASNAQEVKDILNSIEETGEYTVLRQFIDPETMQPDVEEKKYQIGEKLQQQIAKINKELKKAKKFSSTEKQETKDITEEEFDEDDLDKYDSNDGVDENPEKEKRKNERSTDKPLGDSKEGLSAAIMHLTDQIKDGILDKILNGELDQVLKDNGWSEGQIDYIKKQALHHKDLQDSKVKNSKDIKTTTEHVKSSSDTMISSTQETSEYNIQALSHPDKRTLIENKNDKVTSLRQLGVFEFVNKGLLGKLLRGLNYKSKDLPVYYIKGIQGENGALADEILLAVEVNDAFKLLKISPIYTVEIGGKKYQIIGVLFPSETEQSKQSYENIKNLVEQEYENQESQDKQPIVSKHTNRIKRIYSGRFATSSESQKKEQKSLRLILPNQKYEHTKDYIIGFRDQHGQIQLVDDTYDLKNQIIPPNQYGEQYAGGRFLFSRQADGLLYPISISMRRLSGEYLYDNENSEIVKEIKSLLGIIVKNSDETKILDAKRKLEIILVMQDNPNAIWVKMNGKNKIISYRSAGAATSNIISGANNDAIIDKLFDLLVNDEYLFQIHKNAPVEHINKLVQSGCILTDAISIHNSNANFHVHGVDNNGNIIDSIDEVQTWGEIYKPKTVSVNSKKTIYIQMPSEDSYTEFHYDEDRLVGTRWSVGKSQFSLDFDKQAELDNYYRVAQELESRKVDFIVDETNSFAVKRGRSNNSYIIITDPNEIDELNRKNKQGEEKKETKKEEKKEEKNEPETKPEDNTTGDINNDGFDSNNTNRTRRRRSRKDASLDSPMTEEQKKNAADQQHCK